MIEKNVQEAKIRKGLSPRRNSTSLQTQRDIVIPAGTILRDGGDDTFECLVGVDDAGNPATLSIELKPADECPPSLKRVIAA